MQKKDLVRILILALAVVALGAITMAIPTIKEIRKKAFFGSVNVRLDPATDSKAVNEEFDVAIKIEAAALKISGIDLKIAFNKDQLRIVRFTPNNAAFPTDMTNNDPNLLGASTGNARLIAVNTTAGLPTGIFVAGTIRLKGVAASGASLFTLTINQTTSTIVGESATNDVSLSLNQITNGSYTITGGPAATATPTQPAAPAATATPTQPAAPGTPVMNFKVKFQGITQKRADQKVKVIVQKGEFNKAFSDITVTANDNGLYSGSVTLDGVTAGAGYTIFVKGPKHLSRRFCTDNQAERCPSNRNGTITLTAGQNNFDLSKINLLAGDLPDPADTWKQSGVVNSLDYSLFQARLLKDDVDSLKVADVDLSGQVNAGDWLIMRLTLETAYDEDQ